MGALAKLDISGNQLRSTGCKALAEVLRSTKITDLNIASSHIIFKEDAQTEQDTDFTGLSQLTDAIQDMGALASLKINSYAPPVQEIKTATELDLSGKGLKEEDAIVISALIQVRYITAQHKNFHDRFLPCRTMGHWCWSM